MNRKEDYIEDLFRNNEHLLEEKPPRRAWSKLEEKLDLDKAQSTRRIYRYVSTAAAVIAIVAMVSAIALFQNDAFNGNSKSVAMNEKIDANQEFSVNDNASDWRKEYAPEEVETESEIEVKAEAEPEIQPEQIASVRKTEVSKEVVKPSKSKTSKVSETPPIIVGNEAAKEELTKPKKAVPTPKVEEEKIVTRTRKTKSDLGNTPVSNSSEPTIDARMAEVETATEFSNALPQTTYSGNYGERKSKKIKVAKPVISDFHWLLGSWENPTKNGLSYEKWEITGKKSLAANGYLIQGSDTVFIEKMELKQVRNKLFYIANLNDSKSPLKFELKSLENGIATFENTKNTFPKEVILKKDGKNNFVISYEEEMNELQEKQLQYRNNISNAKASRRMSRAFD